MNVNNGGETMRFGVSGQKELILNEVYQGNLRIFFKTT